MNQKLISSLLSSKNLYKTSTISHIKYFSSAPLSTNQNSQKNKTHLHKSSLKLINPNKTFNFLQLNSTLTPLLISSRAASTIENPKFLLTNQNALSGANQNAPNSSSANESVLNLETANQIAPISSSANENVLNLSPANESVLNAVDDFSIPSPPIVEVINSNELSNSIVLNGAGEPTFASLGLGHWTPPGFVQNCLEFLHIDCGFPWWAAILTGTIVVRLLVFPLVIKSQQNAAKMNNNLPQMQIIQTKMTEARQMGDELMAAKYANEMMIFMKEKEINPLKSMLVPLAMAPIFISFFFGLRKMANLPVESLRDGGLFWFTDLTVADPYYILPLITSLTLAATIEMGVDGGRLNTTSNSNLVKYVLRCIPIIVFPLTMNFPAALLCYWVSTNGVSLLQVSILKIPKIRAKFGIPPLKKHAPTTLAVSNKGFVDSAKDSWANVKITRQMQDRERYDELNFQRAGRGPLPKTFKYDPTKVKN